MSLMINVQKRGRALEVKIAADLMALSLIEP
jgi:hypothetical protein